MLRAQLLTLELDLTTFQLQMPLAKSFYHPSAFAFVACRKKSVRDDSAYRKLIRKSRHYNRQNFRLNTLKVISLYWNMRLYMIAICQATMKVFQCTNSLTDTDWCFALEHFEIVWFSK
ncbi:CLUMA_CG007628, isoform A [Clunio marinus]|uniref:CLUMA_CG007628, isoform A n=1 Tax=Clunio marinus TaxID=568069 RepID=A0A1J1I6R1_9DIPT|nr:CLUMA_CG007628, isoform A [Clunio marinus]